MEKQRMMKNIKLLAIILIILLSGCNKIDSKYRIVNIEAYNEKFCRFTLKDIYIHEENSKIFTMIQYPSPLYKKDSCSKYNIGDTIKLTK